MASKKSKKLDSKKAEKETTVLELTQTLATVTVEKTKVERALEERRNEVETLRQQLSDVTRDKASIDDMLKETNLKLQETEDELAQIKTEKSTLWTELVSGRERISDLEEKLKAAETNNATLLETIREQAEEISSLKAELGRPSEIPRQPPPLPIESASKPPPALPPKVKEPSTGDDDAFEDREPSPVAPCPYLSFVPLQDDPRARHKKGKDSEGEKQKKLASEISKKEASEEQTLPSKEATDAIAPSKHLNEPTETVDERLTEATVVSSGDGGQATAVEGEQEDQREVDHQEDSEEPAVPLPDLDVVKPLQKLDSRAALHKSQVGGQIKRKKPSRDLLRQMGSSSNLLGSIPDEQQKAYKLSAPPSSTQQDKEKEKEAKETEIADKDEPSSKQQSVPDEHAPSAAVAQPPKPKPRAAPRKKNVEPTSPNADGGKSLPQAVPRQKSVERELSPLHDIDKSGRDGTISSDEAVSEKNLVDDHANQQKEPILPSPVMVSKASHSPKHHTSADKELGSNESEEHTPKPLPRGHAKTGKDDESSSQAATNEGKIDELMKKDPSELTVKEKALLAQRKVGALGHDKMKPPPIPRKPKPVHASGGEGDTPAITVDGERGRSHSIDEKESNPSPLHGRRKLPPGAVNIMAGLAVSAERGRCNTVSTTEPDVRERNSLGRNASLQDYSQENGVKSSSQEPLEQTDHSTPTKPLPKAPPKRPPLPVQKKPSNEKPQNTESVDKENDTSPPLTRKGDITDNVDGEETVHDESADQSHDVGEGGVDLNTVLTWNPEAVGLWLNSVGLGQYKDLFVGVQGYMLFDMDGHRLKGLGMSSHDDRNLFKKEIKNLKPYADKHKKVLDKQRKEEKKIAKKKKK